MPQAWKSGQEIQQHPNCIPRCKDTRLNEARSNFERSNFEDVRLKSAALDKPSPSTCNCPLGDLAQKPARNECNHLRARLHHGERPRGLRGDCSNCFVEDLALGDAIRDRLAHGVRGAAPCHHVPPEIGQDLPNTRRSGSPCGVWQTVRFWAAVGRGRQRRLYVLQPQPPLERRRTDNEGEDLSTPLCIAWPCGATATTGPQCSQSACPIVPADVNKAPSAARSALACMRRLRKRTASCRRRMFARLPRFCRSGTLLLSSSANSPASAFSTRLFCITSARARSMPPGTLPCPASGTASMNLCARLASPARSAATALSSASALPRAPPWETHVGSDRAHAAARRISSI